MVVGCGSAGASLANEFMRSSSLTQRSLLRPVFIDSRGSDTEASVFIGSSLQNFLSLRSVSGKNFTSREGGNIAEGMEKGHVESLRERLGQKFEDSWIFFRNNKGMIFENMINQARLENVSEVKLVLIFYSLAGATGGGGSPAIGEIFRDNNIPTIGVAILPAEAEGDLASYNALESLSKSLEYMSAVILADNELIGKEDFAQSSKSLNHAYKKLNNFVAKSMKDLVLSPLTGGKVENLTERSYLDFTDFISSVNLNSGEGIEKGIGVLSRATIPLKFQGGFEEARPYKWIELLQKQMSVNLTAELDTRKIQRAVGVVILHESLVRKFPFKDFEQALASLTSLNYVFLGYSRSSKMAVSITLLFSLYPGHIGRIWRMKNIAGSYKNTSLSLYGGKLVDESQGISPSI